MHAGVHAPNGTVETEEGIEQLGSKVLNHREELDEEMPDSGIGCSGGESNVRDQFLKNNGTNDGGTKSALDSAPSVPKLPNGHLASNNHHSPSDQVENNEAASPSLPKNVGLPSATENDSGISLMQGPDRGLDGTTPLVNNKNGDDNDVGDNIAASPKCPDNVGIERDCELDNDQSAPVVTNADASIENLSETGIDSKLDGIENGREDNSGEGSREIPNLSKDRLSDEEMDLSEPDPERRLKSNDSDNESKASKDNEEEDDEDDLFAGLDDVAAMDLHEIGNYTFGKKDSESGCKALSEMPPRAVSEILRREYSERGMRRSVRAVMLVHEHNFPHVLLLQRSDGKGEFMLPGGRLRPGENFEQGLVRKLASKLGRPDASGSDDPVDGALEVGDKRKMNALKSPCYYNSLLFSALQERASRKALFTHNTSRQPCVSS